MLAVFLATLISVCFAVTKQSDWTATCNSNHAQTQKHPSQLCDSTSNCVKHCCLTSGLCPSSACPSSLDAHDSANSNCANNCRDLVECVPVVTGCNTREEHCLGTVNCLDNPSNCDGRRQGALCIWDGRNGPGNFKTCDESRLPGKCNMLFGTAQGAPPIIVTGDLVTSSGIDIGDAVFVFYNNAMLIKIRNVVDPWTLGNNYYVHAGASAHTGNLNNFIFKEEYYSPRNWDYRITPDQLVPLNVDCGADFFFTLASTATKSGGSPQTVYFKNADSVAAGNGWVNSETCACCNSDADCKEGFVATASADCFKETCDAEYGSCIYTPTPVAGTVRCEVNLHGTQF